MKIKKEHLMLACICLIGIAARILKFEDPVAGTDLAVYSHLGKNFIESGKYFFGENFNMGIFSPPGYPLSIGIINLFINDLFFSAKLVSVITSMMTIPLFFMIGKELFDDEAGLFAALVYAVYPVILIISVEPNTEALFFFFLFLSIYIFILAVKKDNFIMYVLLGISFALSYLTRPEGILLLILPFLRLLGFFGARPPINKNYILKTSVMLIIFILLISPYLLFLKKSTGQFTLSGKSNNILLLSELGGGKDYYEVVDAPDNLYDKAAFVLTEDKTSLLEWDKKPNRSLKGYILKDPVVFVSKYLRNVLRELNFLMKDLTPIALPLFFCFFNRELFRMRFAFIFALFPLLYFFMYPMFLIIERQTLVIVLFLVLFSSGGFKNSRSVINVIVNYYNVRKNKALLLLENNIKYIMIFILILSSFLYLKYSSYDKIPQPVEQIEAGYFIKKNISSEYEKLNIMARKPIVNYYSDSRFTMMPYANGIDVINFAKLNNVDYIVVDERFLSKWDYYSELIQLETYSGDVELVYENKADKLIKIYELNKNKDLTS